MAGQSGAEATSSRQCLPLPLDDAGCTGQVFAGETIPLDIYILFDQSGSMSTPTADGDATRIDLVREAVAEFVQQPESAGMGVGLGLFGQEPLGATSCDPLAYATPALDIAVVPAAAPSIIQSLEAVTPTGETPTGAAIQGACGYARGYWEAHPGHAVVLLLVTDGEPKAPITSDAGGCDPTLEEASAAAAECAAGRVAIETYVLGVGPALQNLHQIAEAGGTREAYLVESDSRAAILDALNQIRGEAVVPCELDIGASRFEDGLDYDQVNLIYSDAACEQNTVANVGSADGCDQQAGGWYYDDAGAPTTIVLCPATCDDVSVPGAQLLFSIGCRTIVQ